jgi:hypothetical protein
MRNTKFVSHYIESMEVRLVQEIILIYFYSLNLEQMEQHCTRHLCSNLQFCVTFYYKVILNLFKILKI